MSKWYVIKVMPGKERQLSEQFNTQITMGNIGYISRFVCPLEKEFVVVKNKKVIIPSIWFGPNVDQYNRNYEDIFEKDWEIINTEFKNGKICY